jgi:hypothetical protein
MQEPIIVRARGGDKLKVYLSPLYLEGKVMQIFKGEFLI